MTTPNNPTKLQPGDPCPACGGELAAARVPSAEEWARVQDRERLTMLPPDMDSAPPEQRAELGALHRCITCGYQTRFTDAEPDRAASGRKARA